jgi:S1-C subfamily serine protease
VTRLHGNTPRRLLLVAAVVATAVLAAGLAVAGAARAAVSTGVVEIQTRLAYANGAGAATGLVLTPSGEVLTNNHVIRGASQIRVHVPQSGRTYSARVLGYDVAADVALLQLRGASGLHTVSLGNSSQVRIGQRVTAIGNAGGAGVLTVRTGAVTGLGRSITVNDDLGEAARLTHLIKTDADLRPGDSGGALLDSRGRVIGMNAAASAELVYRSTGGDGYAIPVNRAASIVSQIEAGRSSANVHIGATPFLGITVENRPDNTATGVVVTSVKASSPAARAGLEAGDVIVAVGGHTVRTHAGLVSRLLLRHPGDRISLAWVDGIGNRNAATVTLASGPPQ